MTSRHIQKEQELTMGDDVVRGADSRAFPRRRVSAPIRLRRSGSPLREIRGRLTDLAPGGVCVVVAEPLNLGESIDLHYDNAVQRVQFHAQGHVQGMLSLPDGQKRVAVSFSDRRLDAKTIQMLTWNLR